MVYYEKDIMNMADGDYLIDPVDYANAYLKSISEIGDIVAYSYVYPVPFGLGIQNSSKLRILFSYKIPCMYSGIIMIDPKQLTKLIRNHSFQNPSCQTIKIFDMYKDSIIGVEAEIYKILKERTKVHPDKNIQELLQEVEPVFRRKLRKLQTPIFYKLMEEANNLPADYRKKFLALMNETDKKLNDEPLFLPFSAYEFMYKMTKIKQDVVNGIDVKAKKVMNKLLKEAKNFSKVTDDTTIEHQLEVLRFLEIILKKSVLKNNEQLKSLFITSKARLYKRKIVIPFSRKAFIYDLAKSLDGLKDEELKELMIMTAQELPTSRDCIPAYILKISSESPEKIGFRILWPSLASIEHILPRSCGGEDVLSNFGGATTRENSTRKSIDFTLQLKRRPNAAKNCQKYVDRLIELYHSGIFAKYDISPKYIEDFANTVYVQSKRKLKLDISELYKKSLS